MSRMNGPLVAAIAAAGVIFCMSMWGPWSPRIIDRDTAGMEVSNASLPPRPLHPAWATSRLAATETIR
jgi:hypothetical protein